MTKVQRVWKLQRSLDSWAKKREARALESVALREAAMLLRDYHYLIDNLDETKLLDQIQGPTPFEEEAAI